jgi:hypothetical protein
VDGSLLLLAKWQERSSLLVQDNEIILVSV